MSPPRSFALMVGTLFLTLALALPVQAAPPTLTTISPPGAERGKPAVLVLTGANLTARTQLVLPFKATQKLLPEAKPNPAQVRLEVTIDPSVPLGVYPVRAVTEEGISSLFLFSVDALPNVNEVEDNSSFEKAQKVPFPVIISGQCPGGDVDFFRFPAKKGQRVVIETEAARLGSGVMPQIRLTDAQGRFLAADDTQKVRGDCRIIITAPADGDYVVEFSDSRYRGGTPPVYRLKIGDYDVIEEVFPLGGRRGTTVDFTLQGGTLARPVSVRQPLADAGNRATVTLPVEGVLKAGLLPPRVAVGELPEIIRVQAGSKDPKVFDVAPPLTINGRLDKPGAADRYQFSVQAGQRFRFTVQAETLGSNLDGVLRITDQAGKQLALVDDVPLPALVAGQQPGLSIDPFTDLTVPAGTTLLVVELRDQRHRGGLNFGYRLTIEPTTADFTVHQPVAEVNVPRGGSKALAVAVTRRGYLGPIRLTVPDLPAGLTVQGGLVPAGGSFGVLTLSAAPQAQAPGGLLFLHLEGRATSDGQEIRRRAEQRLVLSRDPNVTPSGITLRRLAVGLTGPEPFTVQGPAAVEVVKGYSATLPVTVARAMNQAALAVEVTGAVPAPGAAPGQANPAAPLAFKPATAAAGAATATITLTPAANALEASPFNLVVQGKARVNNADKLVTSPAVTVTVLRPFTVTLTPPTLTVIRGQTITLKGRIQRQPVFKEAVTLALAGLPAGLTLAAPLKPLTGTESDFQIELRAAPNAAPAMANLTLTCSTRIGTMAYAHPAVAVPVMVAAGK